MVIEQNFYMRLALNEAWKYQGLTYPNPAVGCAVLSKDGKILAVGAHKKAGLPHAEVEALKFAYLYLSNDKKILELTESAQIHNYLLQNHNDCFNGATIFTTLEPCSHIGKTPSCATLISKLKIKKLIVGSLDSNELASGGNRIVQDSGVEVKHGVMQQECDDLLLPFKLWQKDRFVFFKWAQRLNGTVDDGVISSLKSRTKVHAMRDVCDLLVIGGNSVRIDRPTLDARLVNGRAPDILILSRSDDFDKTIPLFSIKNRTVIISDSFDVLKNYRNIMIEGGSEMFESSKEIVDFHLAFISPQFGGKNSFTSREKFKILNLLQDEQDIITWIKRDR
ncbi:MAG: bifunctional diaminohydroxyphosphoribosylaminopyrimidine deaminase/5-amino-6-(5-phosphoribosylamino)uracil reductase RibD [Sulfurimonas sp.]|uniref:bifunctional diaminohydroxyphosphoribosylaminopyrimidine deaminase/5-amino-6-(5-phosphoribosylamino)uracil reductase RibD n=1 Tax=Sulfurimonas sp. TaxID=2022749 RepID=UPI002635580F|nr:bifunctional diaminohydroxyphosphoribosylaminopyrimidine deaminase/5-amino-6-(5-phosphoribosylamino)uracil reductase RibD [Sulfurimonas sp.]MDD3476327.1 bifunctional diaminohydroxyphosphoribosylaminopyrimidine deaminase/5-amino-6-(5-phosphoribosylamino)uracil reductase RibD [Sulfurimonas sp.]